MTLHQNLEGISVKKCPLRIGHTYGIPMHSQRQYFVLIKNKSSLSFKPATFTSSILLQFSVGKHYKVASLNSVKKCPFRKKRIYDFVTSDIQRLEEKKLVGLDASKFCSFHIWPICYTKFKKIKENKQLHFWPTVRLIDVPWLWNNPSWQQRLRSHYSLSNMSEHFQVVLTS